MAEINKLKNTSMFGMFIWQQVNADIFGLDFDFDPNYNDETMWLYRQVACYYGIPAWMDRS